MPSAQKFASEVHGESSIGRGSFQSLAPQVANALRQEIAAGIWRDWLPGERLLVEQFKISRKTLRKALKQLALEGVLQTHHGTGHQIMERRHGRAGKPVTERTVGLLLPDHIELQRPFTAHWVGAMRELLAKHNVRLRLFTGPKLYHQSPASVLSKLTAHAPQSCWVLTHSTRRAQHWFQANALPCVIAGSVHIGVQLPSVDLDYYALCRHAALTIRRAGHKSAAFLMASSETAGDLQSQRGFLDGMNDKQKGSEGYVAQHDSTVQGVRQTVRRLLAIPNRPTALMVANPNFYLSVLSCLAALGLRIPDDMALVSRDDDSVLPYLLPEPVRYSCSPTMFATRIGNAVLGVLRGAVPANATIRIMPRFTPGGTLITLR